MDDFGLRQRNFMIAGGQTVDQVNLRQAEKYFYHVKEEFFELMDSLGLILYRDESIDSRNIDAIVKALDAIADLKVVANGLAWSLGVNPTQIDSIVADANDRKLVGGEVYRRPDGQIGKPPGWVGPEAEIEEVVKRVQAN